EVYRCSNHIEMFLLGVVFTFFDNWFFKTTIDSDLKSCRKDCIGQFAYIYKTTYNDSGQKVGVEFFGTFVLVTQAQLGFHYVMCFFGSPKRQCHYNSGDK